jgi:hypothetical protein
MLREENGLRAFEKRVLRRIFGPQREEGAGGCRRLHYEKLHNFLPLLIIIGVTKSMEIDG